MATVELKVEVRVAWWFRCLYLPGLNAMLWLCHSLGFWWVDVDREKLHRVLRRAVSVSFVSSVRGG